jgi:16S rRNA U1498 N3-methylase RsmE
VPLALGDRRLRAETAAITALALIMHRLGEI